MPSCSTLPSLKAIRAIDGEMAGPGASVDGEIALYNGTSGATLKRANQTGILKATSGVLAAAVAGTDVVVPGGALGTPSSGTLTNCTGLPVAGIAPSTSTALGVGSIELGHASDTSITRTGAGAIAVEGVGVALNSTSQTHTASTIELGHASDTTLSRSAAGVLAVEGVDLTANIVQNSQSTAYTCVPVRR